WVDASDNSMQTELLEKDGNDRAPALGRVPTPVVVRMDDVPELAGRVLTAEELKGEVTDHGARLLQLGRESQEVALRDYRRRCDLLVERLANLVVRTRVPQQVPRHVGTRLVGIQRREVGRCERPQEESVRLND